MMINMMMLPLNGLLAWAWVGGHLGLPALGAVGAAYATATVSWAGALAMIAVVWFLPRAATRKVRDFSAPALKRALKGAGPLAWFGLVPAVGAMLELAGFSILMVLSTQLGNASAGAFQAMLSIHNIAFALSMGFGSAAGVRVGNAVGAGERAQAWPRAMIAAALAAGLLGLISLVLVLFAPALVWPFSDDPEVLALAALMLSIMGAFPFRLDGDGFRRHRLAYQIRPPHAAFGEQGISTRSARSHNPRRELALVQVKRVIQARLEHRRRTAAVFGRAQNQDEIGRARFVAARLLLDQDRDVGHKDDEAGTGQGCQIPEQPTHGSLCDGFLCR